MSEFMFAETKLAAPEFANMVNPEISDQSTLYQSALLKLILRIFNGSDDGQPAELELKKEDSVVVSSWKKQTELTRPLFA